MTLSNPTSAAEARPARRVRPQVTLSVVRREQLSPHLVRVVLGGDQFDDFASNDSPEPSPGAGAERPANTDRYVKIFFAKPELGLEPPYDLTALRESGTLASEDLPVTRTYTVGAVDLDARTLSIDFVVHGDEGLAGPWANRAKPGDTLTFAGPDGGYAPDPEADWHLFAGDQSALPAIAAALEALPEGARGLAFIEVPDRSEVLALDAPAGVRVSWVFSGSHAVPDVRQQPADEVPKAALAEAVDRADWLPGRPQVFAHGEREAMKELREVFKRRGVLRSELSLSGYWARGRTEDRFQAEKREPVGVILPVSD